MYAWVCVCTISPPDVCDSNYHLHATRLIRNFLVDVSFVVVLFWYFMMRIFWYLFGIRMLNRKLPPPPTPTLFVISAALKHHFGFTNIFVCAQFYFSNLFILGYSPCSHREQEQRNAEDVLFDMFASEETGLISMGKFLAGLKTTGIRRTDPRVRELMDNLKKVHKLNNYETGSSAETQHLNRETFKA